MQNYNKNATQTHLSAFTPFCDEPEGLIVPADGEASKCCSLHNIVHATSTNTVIQGQYQQTNLTINPIKLV